MITEKRSVGSQKETPPAAPAREVFKARKQRPETYYRKFDYKALEKDPEKYYEEEYEGWSKSFHSRCEWIVEESGKEIEDRQKNIEVHQKFKEETRGEYSGYKGRELLERLSKLDQFIEFDREQIAEARQRLQGSLENERLSLQRSKDMVTARIASATGGYWRPESDEGASSEERARIIADRTRTLYPELRMIEKQLRDVEEEYRTRITLPRQEKEKLAAIKHSLK